MLGMPSKHFIVRSPVHHADWPGIPEGKYWDEGGSRANWSRRVTASAEREKAESRALEAVVAPASPLEEICFPQRANEGVQRAKERGSRKR